MNPTPLERTEQPTLTSARFEDLVQEMLVRLGEDPNREGLAATPERVHKAMKFLTKGYQEDPEALLKGALFTVNYDEMVIVKDIEVFSLCEHHLLPFFESVSRPRSRRPSRRSLRPKASASSSKPATSA